MKHIKKYGEIFEELGPPAMEQLEFLSNFVKGSWGLNPETGLVDVDGSFSSQAAGLKTLMFVNLGRVSGSFNCSHNQLTSLEGAPKEVGGGFYCHKNRLATLKGSPQKVGGDFNCSYNQLTSLEGAPQEVGGDFYCWGTNTGSLEGAPQEVGGVFYLDGSRGFKWTTEGKIGHATKYPECAHLILPTLPYDSLVETVSSHPYLLKSLENSDVNLYDKLLKDLGWDKMGPDLLRQLKDGIL